MPHVLIRHFQNSDRDAVRGIAWDTAFLGQPADIFFEGKDTFADFLTLYFTDFEPASCFVAEYEDRIVGYLIGAEDSRFIKKVFQFKILPRLLARAFLEGAFLKKKNIIFIFFLSRSFFRKEFSMPDFIQQYPATLHINIVKEFRGFGIGARLISRYLEYLAENKIRGVHFATVSTKASEFFKEQGFELLFSGSRSYFQHILHTDIPIYIFGKKLSAFG